MVTIIKPSWLEVENATIFLMSFCVRAQIAVNVVVRAPRHKHRERGTGLFSIRGLNRTSKKMPATTIVLEWSRADTGVGPSIAAGSHGWRPNCADFPVAARIRARRGRVWSIDLLVIRICWISQLPMLMANQAKPKIIPISPIRL